MIFTTTDRFQGWIDYLEANNGCVEGIAWARKQGEVSCLEGINAMLTDPAFNIGWATWVWSDHRHTLTPELQELFIDKHCQRPRAAAHLYIEGEGLTVEQQNKLLRVFHSNSRVDNKVLYPTIEKELQDRTIEPKFRQQSGIR